MRTRYEIYRRGYRLDGPHLDVVVCHRRDVARVAWLRMAYDLIASCAQLDTKNGHRIMDQAKALAIEPQRRGYLMHHTIYLDPKDTCGPRISIWIERR